MVAGLTSDDLYFSNRFILIKLAQEKYAAEFILALLNSSALNKYFKIRFPITDVDGYMLHQLPIRRIDFRTAASKRATLLSGAKQLYDRAIIDRDFVASLNFVSEQLSAKPERADVVHDLLAFLAKQMMDLNEHQCTAARQFLTDLKDFHGIDARTLNPKTKLDEFWKLDTGEVFAHLNKNRKALAAAKVNLNEAAENKIRSRFEQSKSAILPMEAQIKFTDELIDQIVYRLYGLTPEEIKLIQSSQVAPPANAKTTLFRQVLPQLKEATPYFTTAAVVRRVKELGLKISEGTLPVYLSEATASGLVHDAGRGWYSRFNQPVPLVSKPVTKLIRAVEKAFPLLDFSVWSTAQINPWMHHLLAQPVAFLYAPSDTLESIGDTLRAQDWEVAVDPAKKEGSNVVRPSEKMVVLRPTHSKQPAPLGRQAKIEQILVELQVETSRLALMDDSEAQGVVKGILSQYLVQVAELKTYADFRLVEIDALNTIN